MPAGEANREEIILEVNAPARDFLREGGIANAIAALDVLDARLNKTNTLFAQLGGLGGASAPSGLSSQISQTSQLTSEVTRLAEAQRVLKVVTSQSPSGDETYSVATTTGDRFRQETVFEVEGVQKDKRVVENFEAERRAQEAQRRASYASEYTRFANERKQGLFDAVIEASGTPNQIRKAKAEALASYHFDVAQKAGDLMGRASGAGDEKEALSMQTKHSQGMLDFAKNTQIANQAADQFNQSNRLIGKNMLENIKHVTTWAASVGVLYGTLTVLRRSLEENIAIGREMAVLGQIFKGTASEVSDLTTKVMELAAANGQNATQAVEAATEFARIYHTQGEILEATNSALVLANVSGEEAGHTVEFLSAMTMVYKLHASELAGVIGQMAYASQNFNVTNKDLMKGLEATSESAKEAGISFSQLLGFISAGVGATGQSGTAVGNTVKTMIQEMANPEIQQKLRTEGIEVTRGGLGLKEMPEIFQQMFVAYEKMSEAERRSMLFNVAGRQNATRMAGILDNYVQSQIIAIQAQLHLNSAQEENEKIMKTLSAQTAAMVAEWDKFVKIQGEHGPMAALTGMAEALKNLLTIVNAPGMNLLVALLGGAALAAGARFAVTGIGMNMESTAMSGIKGALVPSTIREAKKEWEFLKLVMAETAQVGQERLLGALTKIGLGGTSAAQGLLQAGLAAKAAGLGFAVLVDVLLPLFDIAIVIHDINAGIAAFKGPNFASARDVYTGKAGAAKDSAALFRTAYDVLSDPSSSQEAKDEMASQLKSGLGVDVGGPGGIGNLLNLASSQDAESAANARMAIQQQKNLVNQKQISVDRLKLKAYYDQHGNFGATGAEGKGLGLWSLMDDIGLGGNPQSDLTEEDAELTGLRNQLKQMIRDQVIHPSGQGFVKTETAKRLPGARIGALSSGIGGIYGAMGTVTALDEHHRDLARLQSDQEMKQAAFDSLLGKSKDIESLPGIQAQETARFAQQALIDANVALQSQSSPQIDEQRRQQTIMSGAMQLGGAQLAGQARGFTEGEQMAAMDQQGKIMLEQLDTSHELAAAHAVRIGLIENEVKAQEKILELQREQFNLGEKARLEYARSLLTSSPSQLLEKLAVGQLSKNGMSAGSFFAMTGSAREDFMRRPGNTEEERQARRSENALMSHFGQYMSPNAFGTALAGKSFGSNAYRDIYGSGVGTPDLGLAGAMGEHVTSFGTAVAQFGSWVKALNGLLAQGGVKQIASLGTRGFKSPNFLPQNEVLAAGAIYSF